MGDADIGRRAERLWLWGILALAATLRLAFLNPYGVLFYDELFQYVEQAWRQVSGDGVVTWDIRDHVRPALLPLLLAVPARIGLAVGGSAFAAIVAIRLAVMAASLSAVVAAWSIGRRWSPLHGVLAAAALAIWYEAIQLGDHVLSESLAVDAFLAGAALAASSAGKTRMAMAGLLFGLTAVLRMQYAPAVAIYVLLAVPWRRWGWLALGGVALIAEGAADLASGIVPFEWVLNNFHANITEGRMAAVSTMGPLYYLANLNYAWGGVLLVPIGLLAWQAGRKALPFAAAAAAVVLVHQLIGHKEYRYIALAVMLAILLAGIGLGAVARRLVRRGWPATAAIGLGLALCSAGSAWAAWHNELALAIEREEAPMLRSLRLVGQDSEVCAVAVPVSAISGISRAYLGRPMPIYVLTGDDLRDPARLAADSAGFNAAILPRGHRLRGFRETGCVGKPGLCVQRRTGRCEPGDALKRQEVQAFFEREGL